MVGKNKTSKFEKILLKICEPFYMIGIMVYGFLGIVLTSQIVATLSPFSKYLVSIVSFIGISSLIIVNTINYINKEDDSNGN